MKSWSFVLLLVSFPLFAEPIFYGTFFEGNWISRFGIQREVPWVEGSDRMQIVTDGETKRTVLRVCYPAQKWGNDDTGTQWKSYLAHPFEHLIVSYKVKFEKDFDFVKGGKLPGFVGGSKPGHPDSVVSGGYKPNGTDGWSARIMWRKDGRIVQYVYHRDQPTNFGEDFPWKQNGKDMQFVPGKWFTVKTEIKMNTPGKNDGIIRSWLDGIQSLERTNLRFRDVDKFGIDAFYFSTFFGGDDKSWATKKQEYAYFDEVVIEYP